MCRQVVSFPPFCRGVAVRIARVVVFGVLCPCLILSGGSACFAQEEEDEDVLQMVVDFLLDEDKMVRSMAFEQVRTELKGQKVTERLAAMLADLPTDAKVGLLSALADRGDRAARPAVLKLITAEGVAGHGKPVSVAAIEALGYLGESGDTELLIRLLAEGSDAQKTAARASLVRLQGEGVLAAIVAQVKQGTPPIRVALIEILTTRRALDTIPDMVAVAVDDDASVRTAAMKALGTLAGPECVAGMVQGVLRAEPGREREAAEKAVRAACFRAEDPDRRAEPLLAVYKELEESDQTALLSTLGRVGGSDVLKIVEAAIGSSDERLHELGIRAVCNWPDASIAPRLTELATSDEHDPHKTSALRALIRVAVLKKDARTDTERVELLKKAMTMATHDRERHLVLDRARTVATMESLHFILPYMDEPAHAERACLSIVELAHRKELRQPNKAEFDQILDRVIATSKDAVVVDRAQRYQKDQTWTRPPKPEPRPKPAVVADQSPSVDEPVEQASTSEEAEPSERDVEAEEPKEQSSMMWVLVVLGGICLLVIVSWRLVSRP